MNRVKVVKLHDWGGGGGVKHIFIKTEEHLNFQAVKLSTFELTKTQSLLS